MPALENRRVRLSPLTLSAAMLSVAGAITPAWSDVYVVNTVAGDNDGVCEGAPGDCSLLEAVAAANARSGPDTVSFAGLPGTAPWRIAPALTTVSISDSDTRIDGWTAPGWVDAPLVEVVGATLRSTNVDNTLFRGLVVSGGSGAISISTGAGSRVQGNYIGTDISGTRNLGAGSIGVSVLGTDGAIIGTDGDGTDDALEGNVIVGAATGILLNGSFNQNYVGNVIAGNLIGTDVTGTEPLGNSNGILVNVDSYNGLRIGTDGDGTSDALERNVIAASAQHGIWDRGTDTLISGNLIGTDINGCAGLGNGQAGIRLDSGGTVGGSAPGTGNTIAGNLQAGVLVVSTAASATISANEIFRNGQVPIDLSATFVGSTPNDPGDVDGGANGLQNYPELSAATSIGNEVEITGSLDSAPNTEYRIEVFAGAMCREGIFGEAERYVGSFSVTTGPTGLVDFNERVGALDATVTPFVSTTATDPLGNTSEVSYCVSLDDLTLFREDFEAACRLPWQR